MGHLGCWLHFQRRHNADWRPALERNVMIDDFPASIAKDGTVVVALQWDYAAWTSGAATFTEEVQKLADKPRTKGF